MKKEKKHLLFCKMLILKTVSSVFYFYSCNNIRKAENQDLNIHCENLISAFYEVRAKFLRWRMGGGTKSVETISKIPIFSIVAQAILTTLRLRKIGSKCEET